MVLTIPPVIRRHHAIQLFNATYSTDHYAQYNSMGSQFVDSTPDEGLFGKVQLADPVDACSYLNNTYKPEPSQEGNRTIYSILLIKRGGCEFHEKVIDKTILERG